MSRFGNGKRALFQNGQTNIPPSQKQLPGQRQASQAAAQDGNVVSGSRGRHDIRSPLHGRQFLFAVMGDFSDPIPLALERVRGQTETLKRRRAVERAEVRIRPACIEPA